MYRGPIGVMMLTTPSTSFSIHMLNLPGVRFLNAARAPQRARHYCTSRGALTNEFL